MNVCLFTPPKVLVICELYKSIAVQKDTLLVDDW